MQFFKHPSVLPVLSDQLIQIVTYTRAPLNGYKLKGNIFYVIWKTTGSIQLRRDACLMHILQNAPVLYVPLKIFSITDF